MTRNSLRREYDNYATHELIKHIEAHKQEAKRATRTRLGEISLAIAERMQIEVDRRRSVVGVNKEFPQ